MSFIKSQIGAIEYNPARGAFEALVSFHGHHGTARIPASFRAPLTADFTTISNGLFQAALRARAAKDTMRSFRPVEPEAVQPRAA